MKIGDRFQIGKVVLEITFGRIPCATLESRMGIAGFVKRFMIASRPGVYTRVLSSGIARPNDLVTFLPTPENYPTVHELFMLFHTKKRSPLLLKKALKAPIAKRSKEIFQLWLNTAK